VAGYLKLIPHGENFLRAGIRKARALWHALMLCLVLHRNRAAALALAAVLTGTTRVPALAAALALAGIVAFAGMLFSRGTTALTLTFIVTFAFVLVRLAATLALTGVQAFTSVLVIGFLGFFRVNRGGRDRLHGRASQDPTNGSRQDLALQLAILNQHVLLLLDKSTTLGAPSGHPGSGLTTEGQNFMQ